MAIHEPVVAGVDGSVASLTAAEWAAAEADHRHLPLRLVYAGPPPDRDGFGQAARRPGRTMTPARALRLLTGAADRIRRSYPDLAVGTAVVDGSAAEVLVAESAAAALVVVGATGRGDLVARVTGSIATDVATRARTGVVVVRQPTGPAGAGRPVVVGVDGSGPATGALTYAFETAAARRVPLVAVHVRHELPADDRSPGARWRNRRVDTDSEAHRLFAEQLDIWRRKFPDVDVDARVVYGFHPAVSLAEASEGAGLLVIGCRGLGATRSPLGAVSRAMIHHAHCSVAVIHPRTDGGQS